jgi:hypothetical protein
LGADVSDKNPIKRLVSRRDIPEGHNIRFCYVTQTDAFRSGFETLNYIIRVSPSFPQYLVELYGADDCILHVEKFRTINYFKLSGYSAQIWSEYKIVL